MSEEITQSQSMSEQIEAERLSRVAALPPTQLPGYSIERFLGEGAFGQVWVGRDLNTGRQVAIKFYLHRGGVDWALLEREVKHLVQLSTDRHIVQVLDVGWQSSPPFYVMEYLSQGSLESLLESHGRLPVSKAISLFYGICIGLNHSHGKGVLHCDLKPANVLLDDDYRPRLADFGQSRMTGEQTPALGTLFYMAPEQADLEAAPDVRWDVYGLGAILYRMLTGNPPHRNQELIKKIDTAGTLPRRLEQYRQAILRDGPPRDHHRRKGVDKALAEIVDGCLAVQPEQRFANVQQVIEALDRREANRQRRPLVLLGIVGPLLLLLLTVILTTRSIFETQGTVVTALRQRARESNRFAALFAAKNFELQLRDYFQFVEKEASDKQLRDALAEATDDTGLTELRDDIATRTHVEEARSKLLEHPARQRLQRVLEEYLLQHDDSENDTSRVDLATVFVTDNDGTMLAFAFKKPDPDKDGRQQEVENSTGRNFAYRAYFHGGREDLDPDTPISTIQTLGRTSLSPAFLSSATGIWKVAVSTPIYLESPSLPDAEPDGVFVATTNLGDFDLISAAHDNLVAMLVDSRPGERQGTVIQHPLINSPREDGDTSGWYAGNTDDVPTVDRETLASLLEGRDVDFRDPLADVVGGEHYRGIWIADVQSVSLYRSGKQEMGDDRNTDLLVLVENRLTEVIAPVGELIKRLMLYGAMAVVAILVVIFLLWYMVSHTSDDSRLENSEPTDVPTKRSSGETETIQLR